MRLFYRCHMNSLDCMLYREVVSMAASEHSQFDMEVGPLYRTLRRGHQAGRQAVGFNIYSPLLAKLDTELSESIPDNTPQPRISHLFISNDGPPSSLTF